MEAYGSVGQFPVAGTDSFVVAAAAYLPVRRREQLNLIVDGFVPEPRRTFLFVAPWLPFRRIDPGAPPGGAPEETRRRFLFFPPWAPLKRREDSGAPPSGAPEETRRRYLDLPAWMPWRRVELPGASSPDAPDERRRLVPQEAAVVTSWLPLLRRLEPLSLVEFSPSWRRLLPAALLPVPPASLEMDLLIIPWDEKSPSARTRQHEQRVSIMLNSLLWRGELVEVQAGEFSWGYVPGNAASWDGDPPATVLDAIDRIASLLGSLGIGP